MPKVSNFRVIIEQDEDGLFVAEVPSIPGCYTQGKTYEETIKRIKEVIQLCLEAAEENPKYKAKLKLNEDNTSSSKFIGVEDVPVRVTF